MAPDSTDTPATATEGRERLALAAGGALLVAGLLLVGAVLPAEYGVDPLGIGGKLGLTAMGDVAKSLQTFQATRDGNAGVKTVVPQPKAFHQETVDFTLKPRGSVEYKYRLDKGTALLYSWTSTGSVNYELHAEPDGAPRGYAESYEKVDAQQTASGTLTAPFPGIHGWYWENREDHDVTVTLTTAGYYTMSHEFRSDAPTKTKMFP